MATKPETEHTPEIDHIDDLIAGPLADAIKNPTDKDGEQFGWSTSFLTRDEAAQRMAKQAVLAAQKNNWVLVPVDIANGHFRTERAEARADAAEALLSSLVQSCTTGDYATDGRPIGMRVPDKSVVETARAFLAKLEARGK